MAKTYILEPTVVSLTASNGGFNGTITTDYDVMDHIGLGTILEVGDAKYTCTEVPPEHHSSNFEITNGDSQASNMASVYIIGGELHVSGTAPSITTSGEYTVSIYTETEDVDPYPVKNFTYEHAEVAKNDIEDIIQAIYISREETESQAAHGYSPADRLVIAVAKLHGVNPEKALTTGNYPNQIKRIAAIIRGDFGSDSSVG